MKAETFSKLHQGKTLSDGQGESTDNELACKPEGKTHRYIPPSRTPFDTKGYALYQAKPLESKREYLRNEWLDVTYLTLSKAKLFAQSVTKKDYGRLMQLTTVAGIAHDKVFPKGDTLGTNLVMNIFNGLPQAKVCTVIGATPVPKGEPLVDNSTPSENT